jgi:hypothetical protein
MVVFNRLALILPLPEARQSPRGRAPLAQGFFSRSRMRMPHADYNLTPADPRDLAEAVAFALRFFEGRTNTTRTPSGPRSQRSASCATWIAPASSS